MIPLYKPFMPDSLPELSNILHSGALAYGKWGKAFEKKLAEFIGEKNIAIVNSFNSAMLVAIAALELQPNDEVIVSPMSCLASNQPLITQRLKVIWADIDPKTGTLDPESVKKKITSKTKAIFHNHHCGYPGYIDEINQLAKDNGVYIIDDAIEAFGSEYKGKKIGNTGADITVFSFQTVRLPNSIDGGALAVNNAELFQKVIKIRDLGVDRSIFRDENGEISKACDISLLGYGATMSDVNSYIGYNQMLNLESLLEVQRQNANKWNNYFQQEEKNIEISTNHGIYPNYWIYGLLTENKLKFIDEMRKKGFYASGVHLNNNCYTVFKDKTELKGVNSFYSKFVAIPCGWWFKNE